MRSSSICKKIEVVFHLQLNWGRLPITLNLGCLPFSAYLPLYKAVLILSLCGWVGGWVAGWVAGSRVIIKLNSASWSWSWAELGKRTSWGWAVPSSGKAKLARQLTEAVLTGWNEQSQVRCTFHKPLVTNNLTSLKSWDSERTAVKEKKCAKCDNGLPRQMVSPMKLSLYAFFPEEIDDRSRLKKSWKNPKLTKLWKNSKNRNTAPRAHTRTLTNSDQPGVTSRSCWSIFMKILFLSDQNWVS
jgi:hypothetical protein